MPLESCIFGPTPPPPCSAAGGWRPPPSPPLIMYCFPLRLIHDQDVFEAFYQKDLAKRLLVGRDVSVCGWIGNFQINNCKLGIFRLTNCKLGFVVLQIQNCELVIIEKVREAVRATSNKVQTVNTEIVNWLYAAYYKNCELWKEKVQTINKEIVNWWPAVYYRNCELWKEKVQIANKEIVNWLSATYRGLSCANCKLRLCKIVMLSVLWLTFLKLWFTIECQSGDLKLRPGNIVNCNHWE